MNLSHLFHVRILISSEPYRCLFLDLNHLVCRSIHCALLTRRAILDGLVLQV